MLPIRGNNPEPASLDKNYRFALGCSRAEMVGGVQHAVYGATDRLDPRSESSV